MTNTPEDTQNLTPTTPDGLPLPQPKQPSPAPLPPTVTPNVPKQTPARRIPAWRFLAVMLFQSALIVAVPFQSALTYARGETVTLQTAPVDPYDLLRGYSQTLSFDISDPNVLKPLPGGEEVLTWKNEGELIYVTLAAPNKVAAEFDELAMPRPWTPVAVSLEHPDSLEPGQVALRGRYRSWRITYGLETYYMPEDQRNDINDRIREVQQANAEAFVVDVKVDTNGNSVPLSLWIEDQPYRF
ncbi:MAG: GDYXXLXY domain-containing protein [Cyanobacteria bacterium P01_F01_bin.3]